MPPFSTQASAVAFFPMSVSPNTHRYRPCGLFVCVYVCVCLCVRLCVP